MSALITHNPPTSAKSTIHKYWRSQILPKLFDTLFSIQILYRERYGAFFLSKFNLLFNLLFFFITDIRFSSSTFALFKSDIRFSSSIFVFGRSQVQHSYEQKQDAHRGNLYNRLARVHKSSKSGLKLSSSPLLREHRTSKSEPNLEMTISLDGSDMRFTC